MILSLLHLIPDVLQEEEALLVLVVHLPDEGAAVLVPPVGPEAVLVVAEAIIRYGNPAFSRSSYQTINYVV